MKNKTSLTANLIRLQEHNPLLEDCEQSLMYHLCDKLLTMEQALKVCAKTVDITFPRQRQIAKEALEFDPIKGTAHEPK